MVNLVRLNKFIASNGYSSRRKIDELISLGRVTVNKNTVVELGFKIDPSKDRVAVDGEYIRISTKKTYLILNKPKGVITSVSDDKHRTTVIDLIKLNEKIFPVGRLDYNTTGLLLLTNDGELANKLMHPKSEIYKTYFVKLSKPLEEKHRLKLTGGIKLEGKETAPSKIRYPKKNNNYQDLYISIYEGRNRQVRNMFEHCGYFVRELERTEYAGLKLDDLLQGEWRKLTPEEVLRLNELVKDTPTGNKRVHYAKKEVRRDYSKYKERDDNRGVKKVFKKPERKFTKKDSKYGFKDRQIAERDVRLGFKKIDTGEEPGDVKKDYKKPGKRFDKKNFKKDFKKFGKSDDKGGKTEYRKFDKREDKKDFKKDYKKFDKRDDTGVKKEFKKFNDKKDFKKFGKSDDKKVEMTDFKKFGKSDDKKFEKKDFKKFGKSADKEFEKKDYKKFGKSDDKKFEKKDFKKLGNSDDKKFEKKDFKKFGKSDDKEFEKKDYKKFGKSDDKKFEKKNFKKLGKSDDKKFEKKDYKKFGKRNSKKG